MAIQQQSSVEEDDEPVSTRDEDPPKLGFRWKKRSFSGHLSLSPEELAIRNSLQIPSTSQSASPRPAQKFASQGDGEQQKRRTKPRKPFPGSAAEQNRRTEPYNYRSSRLNRQPVEPQSLHNNPSASIGESSKLSRRLDSPAYRSTNPDRQNRNQRTPHQFPPTAIGEDSTWSRSFSPQAYGPTNPNYRSFEQQTSHQLPRAVVSEDSICSRSLDPHNHRFTDPIGQNGEQQKLQEFTRTVFGEYSAQTRSYVPLTQFKASNHHGGQQTSALTPKKDFPTDSIETRSPEATFHRPIPLNRRTNEQHISAPTPRNVLPKHSIQSRSLEALNYRPIPLIRHTGEPTRRKNDRGHKLDIPRPKHMPITDTIQTPYRSIRDAAEQNIPPNPEQGVLSERPIRHTLDDFRTPSPTKIKTKSKFSDRRKQWSSGRYDDDELEDEEENRRRQRRKEKATRKNIRPPTPIYLPDFISVSNLAAVLRVNVEAFRNKMRALGFEETNNDYILDAETAGLIAAEFNFEPIIDSGDSEDLYPQLPMEDPSVLPPRPPVVTIMGHVDHGKTTLLDWLRKSSVADSEHGGITQHIGAFSVSMPAGRLITFLDTPGHAAFLSMRKRGANVTDIVILVVAADDSVMPQTIEAIKHAQDAQVPMIVAVNKIDKPDSNIQRVKNDLARYGVEIEDFGGDTQVVCVSGKTGQGMAELEESVIALADILDMRAPADGPAEGWVLEATTKKSGRMATVLIRRGTIRPGDVIVAGSAWAKVRSLHNEAGVEVAAAGPGTPIEVDGWKEPPAAGDEVLQAPDEQKAKSVVEFRIEAQRRDEMATEMTAVNEMRRLEHEKREKGKLKKTQRPDEKTDDSEKAALPVYPPGMKEVFFLIKADVSGSVEAILNSVSALGNSEVRPLIIRSGIGHITEFDIDHAAAAKAHIISFNTVVDPQMSRAAETAGVPIINQSIIYRLIEDVKAKLSDQLAPKKTQRVLGEAEVTQIFEINTKGREKIPVAGCKVRNGVITKNGNIRILRKKEIVYDGIFYHLLPSYPTYPANTN